MAIDVTRGATASSTQYPILKLNEGKEVTAISKSAAFTLELAGGDYKTLILMANAGNASANVVFSVGNGIQGAGSDLAVSIASGKTAYLVVDSGYFKNVSGVVSSTIFSSTNVLQATINTTNFILDRDKETAVRARLYWLTLLSFYCGVALSGVLGLWLRVYSVWFCLLPIALTGAAYFWKLRMDN